MTHFFYATNGSLHESFQQNQWKVNNGKCGICGDPYNGVRSNELPNGRYAVNLVITAKYRAGDQMTAKVQLTANHRGFFVFRLCPASSDLIEVTQECLDGNVLTVLNSPDRRKYIVPDTMPRMYDVQLQLPANLTCNRCVLQWTYTAGNNWGPCDDGKTSRVGCGPQETFRACADIQITNREAEASVTYDDEPTSTIMKDGIEREPVTDPSRRRFYWDNFLPTEPRGSTTTTKPWSRRFIPTTTTSSPPSTSKRATTTTVSPVTSQTGERRDSRTCVSSGRFRKLSGMDQWCSTNCALGFCPASHCKCQ